MKPIGWISDDCQTLLGAGHAGHGTIQAERDDEHPNPVYADSAERRYLAEFVPLLKEAITVAERTFPDGGVEMAVLATKPDGSGQIVARFEPDFVEDLADLVGGTPMTREEEAEETARRG